MLIEVLISAVLVALITVATFTGFQAATRSGATQRVRAEAAQVVAKEQEKLRGLSTNELEQYGKKTLTEEPEVNKTKFKVTNAVSFVSSSSNKFTCEAAGGGANYLQITSSVTWLGALHPVRQSSVVSIPTTAAVEVKVIEADGLPVEGATVEARESGKETGPSQVTPASGCVVFGGLTAGTAYKFYASKSGSMTPTGETSPFKEATPTLTGVSVLEFTLAAAGNLEAKFTSGGAPSEGDTFVAYQTHVETRKFYQAGVAGTFYSTVFSPSLYPFTILKEKVWEPEKYLVYAGDCTANNPETASGGTVKPQEASVVAGHTEPVTIATPPVTVIAYEAAKESEVTENKNTNRVTANIESMKVINKACKSVEAQNGAVKYEHVVKPTVNPAKELVLPAQPYAKELEICIVAKIGASSEPYFKPKNVVVKNETAAGTKATFYMKSVKGAKTPTSC